MQVTKATQLAEEQDKIPYFPGMFTFTAHVCSISHYHLFISGFTKRTSMW